MKKANLSLVLSSILIKLVLVLIVVCCFTAPGIVSFYEQSYILPYGIDSVYVTLLITLYCSAVPALILTVALDRLIVNIKKGNTFIKQNVTCLRIISYCCFAASLIFIYFSFLRCFAWLVVIAAAFFGLILRVIKNVFEQAIEIREENDYTI
ncbi:MAG: DUF2975 domain-containing protein [Ruminiclostridium sp.]|nr:DUF2975 domain-containing protein [Ruminiclostridium sp.]